MKESIGIILTAGAQEKTKGGHRIEPDIEGKIRSHPLFFDFVEGKLDKLIVTGGQPVYGDAVASHYARYLNRKRIIANPRLPEVVAVTSGLETGSDLKAVADILNKEDQITIGSSGYH